MKKRILGLDTGTNSLGWAVVDRDDKNQYSLIKRGDLIFDEGVKIEKGIESSKATERTGHRGLRRQYFRRRLRKIEVLRVLVKYGLCPHVSDEELHLWHTRKVYPKNDGLLLWQRTDENDGKNPYIYRCRCLHEKLDLSNTADRMVLGRAMYHLAQRRGFLSNRLDSSEDEKEDGAVKGGISSLTNEMQAAGCEYLGEYFYRLYNELGNTVKIRNRYTSREQHYKKEFYAICEKQQLDDQLIEELAKALYFQRPLKSQRHSVGKCTFEPSKTRCADSHPAYEEFRMLSFVNTIKVKSPYDEELRVLNAKEREAIAKLFYRKSKPNFDFEDIAKELAGRKNYCYIGDMADKAYKFNYRMSQGVSGCPTTTSLMGVFGQEWRASIAETYLATDTKLGQKSVDGMVDDVWNVLYSFSSKEKLRDFGRTKLQLSDEAAEKFANIRLTHSFASLSLKAIRKINVFLRMGLVYSHAVTLANIPTIVGPDVWQTQHEYILKELLPLIENFNPRDTELQGTLDFCVKDFLRNNFDLKQGAADKLYHPSMIETYPDAGVNAKGVLQLGSPRTNAIRNPMAMRSLHKMRLVINQLLREGTINQDTEIHIEYARELNDANKRKAISDWQKSKEKERKKYEGEIIALYKEETGKEITPTDTDILKFKLWEEQNHICLYTGKQIGIAEFLGTNPRYDIEHTVPQSVGGDSTDMNLTLCDSRFNRDIKKAQLPIQLENHADILVRIAEWKERYEKLSKDIDRIRTHSGMAKEIKDRLIQKRHRLKLERDYWRGKYERFVMEEVPEGFSRRQGAGIGLISKYAGLYLKSLFHDKNDRNKSHVFVVKGTTTAEFRKMWGLQSEYEQKSRVNHVHHCIDAITIACIGKYEYAQMAQYYHDEAEYLYHHGAKPSFAKPWKTFTEDLLNLERNLLVVHHSQNNMAKRARKKVLTATGEYWAQGDSARGSLHKDTYYGAIERDGKIKYVVRKPISSLKSSDEVDKIVDNTVKEIVRKALEGKNFKEAINAPIYMNQEKGILIKKVRCYAKIKRPIDIRTHRDVSKQEYKQQFHVDNDDNYMIAIYEGVVKGKIKRDFELVKNIEAANFFKQSQDRKDYPTIIPEKSFRNGFPLKTALTTGTMVILFEKNKEEIDFTKTEDISRRLYKLTGMTSMLTDSGEYGVLSLRHHQEARSSKELKSKNGAFKNGEELRPAITMLHTQFNALVQNIDFRMDAIGNIELIK
uniref:CRISPR-associated endonuclease Cas9 n=1 Tax=Prevotella sp. GTC17262 TaxID=3236797 RepID=A0AB33JJ83_9BACT